MKEIILNLLCRKVRILDECYTIGGIIICLFGVLLFLLICGIAESLG